MLDAELDAAVLERLVEHYEKITVESAGKAFPEEPEEQLFGAVTAVFHSWNNTRAKRYRRMQAIPDHLGTACTVQAMVFGNLGATSGSGVAFTRNPSTGERGLYGEYLANAQGEDVVSGVRTPSPLTAGPTVLGRADTSLENTMPEVFAEVAAHCERLERHFRNVQEVEFTIEAGRPYVLQTRTAKRTARAGIRFAVDMVNEGLLTTDEALLLLEASSLEQLVKSRLPTDEELADRGIEPLAIGLPASPGAATGRIVFHADDAVRAAAEGREVILVRRETSPEDVHGMRAAAGVLTASGGMTSHAAVVARGLGKCCVAGCSSIAVDYQTKRISIRSLGRDGATTISLAEGDELTLDGSLGRVYAGAIELVPAAAIPELATVMAWADAV
ncbi:MAG: pyruvate, phosphate dikinase, partial [Polyangiaceae bacterium]|nr:pyruvate, phosphate dikinase [Polyangiaceae bacterium]